MIQSLLARLFGSRNDRNVARYKAQADRIEALEPTMQALSDEALKAKTDEFRARLAQGEKLANLLPEAFAAVREAARRSLGMRHYNVQLVGGMALNDGRIAEMRTGEGKTLVATLPAYLNALPGKGVHVVTVNDYLARRDAAWMAPVYGALGMTVGVVTPGQNPADKRVAYRADITYATNNEIGFDYLRDNMALAAEDRFQRPPHYAIIDEVDSILIDEARTPLIISGPADESPSLYVDINKIIPRLIRQQREDGPGDYTIDEKAKQVHLTEAGMEHAESLLVEAKIIDSAGSLYDVSNLAVVHHLHAALRAHQLFRRDVDYIVRNGEVVIVDEFTGRTLAGRRWSDGLHQAIEAKEGVPVQRENQTLASITFQNLFRLYPKLAGMTGTADTEAFEFQQIYGLEVVVIPTHRKMIRDDRVDIVYLKKSPKYRAIIEDIRNCHGRRQPVLVGTTSIETSELLSKMLHEEGVAHEVLNAKQHEREAQIVAQAGRPGAVTIATNMAGRGTDIVLGGNLEAELAALPEDATAGDKAALREQWQLRHDEVIAAGGLHIIGTERHESRRIDNQLRGRAGRQGDPGSSIFYLSLEDDLMRIFASDWVMGMMQRLGMKDDDVIQERMAMRAIERAQRKIEAHNFDLRKHLLEYDDVANDQRREIYATRNQILDSESVSEMIGNIRAAVIEDVVRRHVPAESLEERWKLADLEVELRDEFGLRVDLQKAAAEDDTLTSEKILRQVSEQFGAEMLAKAQRAPAGLFAQAEKEILLRTLDTRWKDHLARMDYLRQGIGLRGYAQKQPMQEYKREAFELFGQFLEELKLEVVKTLARIRVLSEAEVQQMEAERRAAQEAAQARANAQALASFQSKAAVAAMPVVTEQRAAVSDQRVGRNDPCPCGSGRKYKQCHGKLS